MRAVLLIAVLGVAAAALTGCGAPMFFAPVMPPQAGMVTSFRAPLDTDFDATPVAANGPRGRASVVNILGIVSFGDCGAQKAAEQGRIVKITHADYDYFNLMGIYQKFTTIVYGEQ